MNDADKMYSLFETLLFELKSALPTTLPGPMNSSNIVLPPEVRTRLAFLEDMQRRALVILGKAPNWEEGFPPMRAQEEVQRAHDCWWAVVMGDVPSPFDPKDEPLLINTLQTLCWMLRHDHGDQGFEKNYRNLENWLAARGFVMGAAPATK